VIYKITASAQESVLYTFTGGNDGGNPIGGVTLDAAGNLYGTTNYSGSANDGVLFELDTSGAYAVPYTFTGGYDGQNPQAAPVFDSAGNLYGTTSSGTIYKYATGGSYTVLYDDAGLLGSGVTLDPAGNYTVLYTFTSAGGREPKGGVTLDPQGNLYGTTYNGGQVNDGVLFKVTPQ
jgi:uncharacterized repeat protein (TIGR03803 family)